MCKLTIVLYKHDLRIHDHPALYEGAKVGKILPVYIKEKKKKRTAKDVFIDETLKVLKSNFDKMNQSFLILSGESKEILPFLISETGANQVNWNESYTKGERLKDMELKEVINNMGINVNQYNGKTLFNLNNIFNQSGSPYKIFTPFYKKTQQELVIKPLSEPVIDAYHYTGNFSSENIEKNNQKEWEKKLLKYWSAGEEAGISQLNYFLTNGLDDYKIGRDYPARDVVSKLSPYLAVGSLSVRRLYTELVFYEDQKRLNLEAFIRQLIWRDFSYYTLLHFPDFTEESLREQYNNFPWLNEQIDIKAWKNGQTGYPFIDAAMRELWETGYMHNRARMVVGSFLVKHLLVDWKVGFTWFQDTLIDFDPANNAMGWQWVTGSGIDASPFFRVFNPLTQSEKFDPKAEYINQFVPEVKKLHEPSKLSKVKLDQLNIKLGQTYPCLLYTSDAADEQLYV